MTPSLPDGYRIRPTARADIPLLPAIERDAAEVFRSVGLWGPAYEGVRGLDQHEQAVAAGIGWVATRADGVCAFALGSIVDGHLHLHELAVAQAHQRRGLGAALLAVAIDHARWRFDPVITLTTHRDVPWNGPFYRRYGFIEIDGTRLPPGMKRILDDEAAEGFDPSQRCAMAKVL